MFPVVHLGGLAIQTPGLFLLGGFWAGLTLLESHASRHGLSGSRLLNLALIALIAGVVGARLGYLARFPAAFQTHPLDLFSLNFQLADPQTGIAASGLAALIAGQRMRLPFWHTLDALTSLFAPLAVAVALAHLASGSAFGMPANLPWAIVLWGMPRHPAQVYELLAALAVLGLTWPRIEGSPRILAHHAPVAGLRLLTFIGLSAISRLLLEPFRGDSLIWFGQFRAQMLIAWFVLALSLAGVGLRIGRSRSSATTTEVAANGRE